MDQDARRERARKAGQARAKQFTSDYQRWARSHVSSDSCRANGRKGAIATLQRHGKAHLIKQMIDYRLAHPSDLEKQVQGILDGLGADYQREVQIDLPNGQPAVVDFWLDSCNLIIEVDGQVHDLWRDHDHDMARIDGLWSAGYSILWLNWKDRGQIAGQIQQALGITQAPVDQPPATAPRHVAADQDDADRWARHAAALRQMPKVDDDDIPF